MLVLVLGALCAQPPWVLLEPCEVRLILHPFYRLRNWEINEQRRWFLKLVQLTAAVWHLCHSPLADGADPAHGATPLLCRGGGITWAVWRRRKDERVGWNPWGGHEWMPQGLAGPLGTESLFPHLLGVGPWANYVTFLCFHLLICKADNSWMYLTGLLGGVNYSVHGKAFWMASDTE